jgi:hypothetical protein
MMKDKITNVVALANVTAPLWPLESLNQVLTTISLIAGICWILYQFYLKLKDPK